VKTVFPVLLLADIHDLTPNPSPMHRPERWVDKLKFCDFYPIADIDFALSSQERGYQG
jgi:hypothetical protein